MKVPAWRDIVQRDASAIPETRTLRARVPPEDIGFVNALVDAYEGYALMRTRNREKGIVEFWVAPEAYADVRWILEGLAEEVGLEILD
jgi:hypothetical protein